MAGQKKGDLKAILEDLATAGKAAKGGSLPRIDPKKYGFDSEEEYWDYVKRAAGLLSQCQQFCPNHSYRCAKPDGHAGQHNDGIDSWTA